MTTAHAEAMATTEDVINAHLVWMEAGGLAAKTIGAARLVLATADRQLPAGLCAATAEELAAWLGRADWSPSTKSTYHKHLRRFYRWATAPADPWLSFDPSADLRGANVPAGLPRPAAKAVVHRAIHDTADPWRLYCRLAALGGLRPCEIAHLHREDVDADWIRVHRGKGGRSRAVPTHPLVWELVRALPAGPIVRRPSGRPATGDWVSTRTGQYLTALGIATALYGLRHAYATEIQAKYKNLRTTQELLGHASPLTTQRYTEVTEEAKREAVATLDFSAAAGAGSVAPAPGGGAPQPPRRRVVSGRSAAHRDLRRRALARPR